MALRIALRIAGRRRRCIPVCLILYKLRSLLLLYGLPTTASGRDMVTHYERDEIVRAPRTLNPVASGETPECCVQSRRGLALCSVYRPAMYVRANVHMNDGKKCIDRRKETEDWRL